MLDFMGMEVIEQAVTESCINSEELSTQGTFRRYSDFMDVYFPKTAAQEIYNLSPTEFGKEMAKRAVHNVMVSTTDQQGLHPSLLSDRIRST